MKSLKNNINNKIINILVVPFGDMKTLLFLCLGGGMEIETSSISRAVEALPSLVKSHLFWRSGCGRGRGLTL